jgi:hypothetical protein
MSDTRPTDRAPGFYWVRERCLDGPEEMKASGNVTVYVVEWFDANKNTSRFHAVYGAKEDAEAERATFRDPGDVHVDEHEITSPDLLHLRASLRAAEDERDQLRAQLAHALEQIEDLRAQLSAQDVDIIPGTRGNQAS